MQLLLKECLTMKIKNMKKKIIVPVDFSAASHNAYLYARGLAVGYNAIVEVVHVYADTPGEKEVEVAAEMNDLEKQLDDFVALYPKEEEVSASVLVHVEVHKKLLRGLPVKSILQACGQDATPIIVMGMTGSHNAAGRFWGTISSSVAQRASCPVLLIPTGVKYAPFENILYASNYESAENVLVKQAVKFANIFGASLHFIHVREKDEIEDFTETEKRIFEQLFEDGDPSYSFNLASVEAKSITTGLNQYADENNIDLITLVNIQRGFLESMFGHSTTKTMAFSTKLPLMILHLL